MSCIGISLGRVVESLDEGVEVGVGSTGAEGVGLAVSSFPDGGS